MNQTRSSTSATWSRRAALAPLAPLALLAIAVATPSISCLGDGPRVSAQEITAITGTVAVQGGRSPQNVSITVTSEVTGEAARVSDEVEAETVAQGLEVPWALAFPGDGRIFVTERPGRIRVIQNGILLDPPLAVLEVARISEAGLMGIAVDPDFAVNGHLYVCYTYSNDAGPNDAGQLFNRVARLTESGGTADGHRVILDDMPGNRNHNGCRLRFGPDGKPYITMGDAGDRDNAQDLGSLSGKVLRIDADGSIPEDNPFPGSPVYTYGHRNPQGLDWHPTTGNLFITEHGPSQDDEINILSPGANYGWPQVMGMAEDPDYADPILSFTPTLALSGSAFYTGGNLPESWRGNVLFANLKASHLHRVVLQSPEYASVVSHERLFQDRFGRLRGAAMGPDGSFYFTTSNRDGRGTPMSGDDRVMRLIPAPPVESESRQWEQPGPTGRFQLGLPPGSHLIRWDLPGFLAVEQRLDLSPGSGDRTLQEIMLWVGDINGDGSIGAGDLDIMTGVFGAAAVNIDGSDVDLGANDLDGDGMVDVTDLAMLGSNWGSSD